MNAKKILVVAGFAVAAISANAQINLTSGGTTSLGGIFSVLSAQPTYSPGSSISSIVLNNTAMGNGSVNQWWFSVTDSAPITTVTYSITLSGIGANTFVSGLITGQPYDSGSGVVGPGYYIIAGVGTNVEAFTGSTAYTQTLNFTEDISAANTTTAFFKGNFQFANVVPEPSGVAALAVGALGLLIRRRRSK